MDKVTKNIVKHYKKSLKAKSNLTIFIGYAVKLARLAITRIGI